MCVMEKVVLITGASSGIGKAIALKLIQEGCVVYGAARRFEKMNDLAEAGGVAIKMDITNLQDVKHCVDRVVSEHGRVDVLVNNAGYAVYGPVEDVSLEEARKEFEVNVFGLAAITKEVIPHMRKAKKGQIYNMSSVGGKMYSPLGAWYHASKFALEGWSDCLRLELKQFGINVIVVEPGLINTEFGEVLYKPMITRSGKEPYKKMVELMANATRNSYSKPEKSSKPSVIADVIWKSMKTQKPKTRIVKGKMAKFLLRMRKMTSDRTFDKIIMSQIKGI